MTEKQLNVTCELEKPLTATQVMELLATKGLYFDKLYKSRKHPGAYVAHRGFFYRHGNDEQKMAAAIEEAIGAEILEATEYYKTWPQDSYWEVIFRLP